MNTKKLVYTALLLSIGIVLPFSFHSLGIPGTFFLPMHIPVLIAGITVGPLYGTLLGILLPLISHILIQMPAIPILYIMIFELLFYGLISGIIFNKTNNVIISLISSMVVGRLVGALIAYLLFNILGISPIPVNIWIYGSLITGLPGIIIQIIIIPILSKLVLKNSSIQQKSLN